MCEGRVRNGPWKVRALFARAVPQCNPDVCLKHGSTQHCSPEPLSDSSTQRSVLNWTLVNRQGPLIADVSRAQVQLLTIAQSRHTMRSNTQKTLLTETVQGPLNSA